MSVKGFDIVMITDGTRFQQSDGIQSDKLEDCQETVSLYPCNCAKKGLGYCVIVRSSAGYCQFSPRNGGFYDGKVSDFEII